MQQGKIMTHTALFKNEIYLVTTSIVSIGVLTGQTYFDLALAALLIFPVINLPTVNVLRNERQQPNTVDKCASC